MFRDAAGGVLFISLGGEPRDAEQLDFLSDK